MLDAVPIQLWTIVRFEKIVLLFGAVERKNRAERERNERENVKNINATPP